MITYLAVGLGGFIGSVLRFVIQQSLTSKTIPISTIAVNLVGSFFIGFIISAPMLKSNHQAFLFITVGVLGGFTTFSTFSAETVQLLMKQDFLTAGLNIAVTLIGSFGCCFLGFLLARSVAN